MKKYLIAGIFIALAAWYAAEVMFPDTKTITVPVRVYAGDTLDDICIRLAEQYGDERNYKEISWYAQQKNNVGRYIFPGQTLFIDLEVLVKKDDENAAEN